MGYKIIAADMDGTLLNSAGKITENTKQTIKRAIDAGVIYVTATGRSMRGVEFVNDLFDKDLPFILFNGACVMMGKTRKVFFNVFMDFDLAAEVFSLGSQRGYAVVIWTEKGLYTTTEGPDIKRYYLQYGIEMRIIKNLEDLRGENIFKLFWIGPPEEHIINQAQMNDHFAERLNCHTSQPNFLEFVSPDASKGSALEAIGKLMGVDRSEIIAVGDGYNDISMLKYAGLGVAMGNAPDDIKALCGHVTSTNDEEGVAAVLEEFFLK